MTDLKARLDALPKMPSMDDAKYHGMIGDYGWDFAFDRANALAARNALLCDYIRDLEWLAHGQMTVTDMDDCRAILAACEVKP